MSETLILNGKDLTLEDLYSVVYDRRPVQIDPEVIPLVDKSRQGFLTWRLTASPSTA